MRWVPRAIPVLIGLVALDFVLVFGFEAWRILTSPMLGLERLGFAHVIYGLGKLAGLEASQHLMLAALFGIVNLAIAVMLGLHLASRVGALRGHRIMHDTLDAGLILVVVSTLLAATPAILGGATEVLIQERLPLWLVGLAATLSMIERLPDAERNSPPIFMERWALRRIAKYKRKQYAFVSPAMRGNGRSLRWDMLRGDAGFIVEPAPIKATNWFSLYGR